MGPQQDTSTRITTMEERMRDYISGAVILERFNGVDAALGEIREDMKEMREDRKAEKNWVVITLFGVIAALLGLLYNGMQANVESARNQSKVEGKNHETDNRYRSAGAAYGMSIEP